MRPLALLVLLLALALAACGDDEATTPTVSLTTALTETPTASPEPSTTSVASLEQLAYVDADGSLWLVNSDGSGGHKIANECGVRLWWAPTGDFMVCSYLSIIVFDITGRQLWRADDVGGATPALWSTDGRRIAYADEGYSLHVVDVPAVTDTVIEQNAVPLGWLGADTLLAGLNVQRPSEFTVQYDAYVIDLATGDKQRLPFFDNGRRLWMSPTREFAVVAGGAEGVLLSVYEFATGEVRPLPGLVAGGASEAIPDHYVEVSWDGSYVYAANALSQPTTIDRSDVRTGELTHLGTVSASLLAISGEGRVAWLKAGGIPETLTISDLEQGTQIEIGQGYGEMAWRPRP